MMKFASHNSPLLLESLGNLLSHGFTDAMESDAKQLAARAYLRASYESKDAGAKATYRLAAEEVVKSQSEMGSSNSISFSKLESQFTLELADAKQWSDELFAREKKWIEDGLNPETEFDRLYQSDPASVDVEQEPLRLANIAANLASAKHLATLVLCVGIGIGFIVWCVRATKNRRAAS